MIVLLSLCDANEPVADVIGVTVKETSSTYRFSVTLQSDETGCAQYADWWEVLSAKGELLYRRILVHSHPDTQPFTRSGGSVNIASNETVYIRAHMNTVGYKGDVFSGSIDKGFKKVTKVPNFSKMLETQKPLPSGCAF